MDNNSDLGLITNSNSNLKIISNLYQFVFDRQLYRFHILVDPVIGDIEVRNKCINAILFKNEENKKKIDEIFNKAKFCKDDSLYSVKNVDEDIILKSEFDGQQYVVIIKNKGPVKQDIQVPAELISTLGRFFQSMQRHIKLTSIGRQYFDSKKKRQYPDHRLEVWPGFSSGVSQFSKGLLITIDSCFKVVRRVSVLEKMEEVMRSGKDMNEELGNSICITHYNGKFYQINEIDTSKTPNSTFTDKQGQEHSYMNYYKEKYNIRIQVPDQPLIQVLQKVGRSKQEVTLYLIPEICHITGLTDEMRANFNLMKALGEMMKPQPQDRIIQAKNFIAQVREDNKTFIDTWGLAIKDRPIEIRSKQLSPGAFVMQEGNKRIDILTGNLDRDTQTQMFQQVQLNTWAIIGGQEDQNTIDYFLNTMRECISFCQYPCNAPIPIYVKNSRNENSWIDTLKSAPDANSITLIVLILQDFNKNFLLISLTHLGNLIPKFFSNGWVQSVIETFEGQHYTAIKRYLIKEKPIPSQVILSSTIQSCQKGPGNKLRSICNQLLLQINAKAGGTPWTISNMPFNDKPSMLVGIDVYHQTSMKQASILGVVATMDPNFSKYWSTAHVHETGQEISYHLGPAMSEAVAEFKKVNGIYPVNIIIFRDGVSRSQESAVIEVEIPAIKSALEQLDPEYKPKIICLNINQRVEQKFYIGDTLERVENPVSGTLIESDVTQGDSDFYLISQRTTQGTATPTHYRIIFTDIKDDKDLKRKLEILSFQLCYMYFNLTGAIKEPSPIRYAHTLSNFIGDRYEPQNPEKTLIPHPDLLKRRSLYFI